MKFAGRDPDLVAPKRSLAGLARRTLIYKRTHSGDPNPAGQFGCHDCMGVIRARHYEAVIGVGGVGSEPRRNNLAGKLNWIGIGAHKDNAGSGRGPIVTFDHFLDFGDKGPQLTEYAPELAHHIYTFNIRSLMTLTEDEQREVRSILELALGSSPSPAREVRASRRISTDDNCASVTETDRPHTHRAVVRRLRRRPC